MGLITAVAVILATQTVPAGTREIDSSARAVLSQPSQDRLNEIWDNVDNRVIRQLDLWFDAGDFPKSVGLLKVEYAYSPDDYEVVTNLGWMLENLERMDEAKDTYMEFSKEHPKNGNAIFPLGFYYYMKRDFKTAIQILEPSVELNPGPNTFRVLAKSYERLKKYSDAVRIWELELKHFPGEPTAIANIKRVKPKIGSGGK